MSHLYHLILLVSSAAAGSLVHAVGAGILLAGSVAICLRLLPGIKPAIRFFLWLAVLLILLPLHLVPLARTGQSVSLPVNSASFHLDAHWSILIVGLWGALSLLRAIRLIQNAIELRRIAAAATPVEPSPSCKTLLEQGRRFATLCISSEVDRPSVVGFFQPRILLPAEMFRGFSEEELQQILLHEMEHLRRRDDWTNLLQKVALIVFPLNPVLHWVERRLCIERELACDDCVLNFTSARKSYAMCLTNLAEHSLVRRGVSLTLAAWEKRSELSRRVHRILRQPEQTMGRAATNVVTGILVAGLMGGAITLAHTPELISFAPSAVPVASSSQPDTAVMIAPRHAQSKEASAVFVKAVMPEPPQPVAVHRNPERSRPQPVRAIHRSPKPQPEGWVVLTDWQAESPAKATLRHSNLTSSEIPSPSYAAVRVANGWLIFQL